MKYIEREDEWYKLTFASSRKQIPSIYACLDKEIKICKALKQGKTIHDWLIITLTQQVCKEILTNHGHTNRTLLITYKNRKNASKKSRCM